VIEPYVYVIVALLPLSSLMLIFQVNPYNALVIRGVLGGVSALVYGILGAADVALTDALMGTLLAISLYAIAVRSSMVMRLGVIEGENSAIFEGILAKLREILGKWYVRLELIPYDTPEALQDALLNKDIHGTCQQESTENYHTKIRVKRLYDIFNSENYSENLTFFDPKNEKAPEIKH
jgi:putative multicomponent Na+:H+ antiporter subunit B